MALDTSHHLWSIQPCLIDGWWVQQFHDLHGCGLEYSYHKEILQWFCQHSWGVILHTTCQENAAWKCCSVKSWSPWSHCNKYLWTATEQWRKTENKAAQFFIYIYINIDILCRNLYSDWNNTGEAMKIRGLLSQSIWRLSVRQPSIRELVNNWILLDALFVVGQHFCCQWLGATAPGPRFNIR